MATSIIEICNSALTKVGARAIQDLTDDSNEANVCNLRFEPCKRAVLRRHPWNFAIDRVTTAPETGSPAFGATYKHALPSDCLRVILVGPNDLFYRIEGRKLLVDSDIVNLTYIKNVSDPTVMDELFGEALACYLAWDIAYKITQKQTLQRELWIMYLSALRDAKSVDAQEERDYELTADAFVDSRFSGTTPGRSNR